MNSVTFAILQCVTFRLAILHDAARGGYTSTCSTLISLGADINVKNEVSIHLKQSIELGSAASQSLQAALKRIQTIVSVLRTNSYVYTCGL